MRISLILKSCSPNTRVENSDDGFGAGYLASAINRPCH
jgi:NCAIR mutase (PurE)-related protein